MRYQPHQGVKEPAAWQGPTCVVDPTMNLIRRPLLCAAMAMSAARRWSAFWQMRCPTLSQSPSPHTMLTW